MSTYVLMKILESAPGRYDRGIRLLTLGKLDNAYDRLVSRIGEGQRVLDIGCGTGALALRAAGKGAHVKAIDVNPQMMEIARGRAIEAGLDQRIEFCEMGVAELEREEVQGYDAVMSGLCFSELTRDEVIYALRQAMRMLKPGGLLLIADEVRPESVFKRILSVLLRFPLVVITYIITQTTTHAIRNLPGHVKEAGFQIESLNLTLLDTFIVVEARKPKGEGT